MSEAEPIRFGPSPSPAEAQEPTPAPAWAYLLRCPDGSLYGGWTNDLARRVKAHRSGKGGARYTKSHAGTPCAWPTQRNAPIKVRH